MNHIDQIDKNDNHVTKPTKLIYVAIIGRPNAGKSSLLNLMIGQKLSIVTHKPQTTRSMITGIVCVGDTQLVLLDTPGIFDPKLVFEKAMVKCAWSSLQSADTVLLVIDSSKDLDSSLLNIIKRLNARGIDVVYVLNKIDLGHSKHDEISKYLKQNLNANRIFQISAKSGKGSKDLIQYLVNSAKSGSWVYDKDDITNLPIRFLAEEITREQLFLSLEAELPYKLTIYTDSFKESKIGDDVSVTINQVIVVSKESYKMIILGRNGSKIKAIGSAARAAIQKTLDIKKVHLFLFIKVRDWENSELYTQNTASIGF